MDRGRGAPNFTVLAGALFALVAGAVLLSAMLIQAPTPGNASVIVAPPEGAPCPEGSGSPACFQFTVINSGTGDGQVACKITPAKGSSAEFGNGDTEFTTPLDNPFPEGRSLTLTVLTQPLTGKDVSGPPSVTCDVLG